MADIIQLLPDSVANQIAAGEVVQRPSSIVKELMENAIDAGATFIQVNIKDAGKTLIQVTDNGSGMSQTDARLAFERHATSKIKKAADLFSIRTMGFRGEALASIAAISHVELKTKKHEDEVGTCIKLNGSKFISQENIACPSGSNFIIKDIFFNIPARRKFLRSNQVELQHIFVEFQRIALSHPEMNFQFNHNDKLIFKLPKLGFKKVITQLFGNQYAKKLLTVEIETTLVKINGYIGTPEAAKKKYGHQFFFTNSRFIKHPYLHKAIIQAYDKLIPLDYIPLYFLKLEVNPNQIDINIHPTKTVVKFDDEPSIFQILYAGVTKTLGQYNFVPSIDFKEDHSINIPVLSKATTINVPQIEINPTFNPFEKEKSYSKRKIDKNWEKLYEDTEIRNETFRKNNMNFKEKEHLRFFQFKNQYIMVQVKSGLMVMDQKRAHTQILYEKYLNALETTPINSQQLLYQKKIRISKEDYILIDNFRNYFKKIGFNIELLSNTTLLVKGIPQHQTIENIELFIEELIGKLSHAEIKENPHKKFAETLAKLSAIKNNTPLEKLEMETLFNNLFACKSNLYTTDGKKIIHIINRKEIENYLN